MITEKQISKASVANFKAPAEYLAGHKTLLANIAKKAAMVFEEHCSECSYPDCYTSCAFYTPREDMHCRRFEHGFEKVSGTNDLKLVEFRKWGKIEAAGRDDYSSLSKGKADTYEVATKLPCVPYFAKRKFTYELNQNQKHATKRDIIQQSDAFALEVLSADGCDHVITVSIFNVGDGAKGKMYLGQFEVKPKYNRILIHTSDIAKNVDLSKNFLLQIEPLNGAEGRKIAFGTCDFVLFAEGSEFKAKTAPLEKVADAKPAKNAKLVVWDLDETLWRGILAEDGIEGVTPRPEAIAAIKALDERGIVHSIASKNDHDLVIKALEHFGLDEYFLYPQVSWGPKSISIANLAKQISLGIDSFVFIDDQPFERAEVGNTYPQIRVLTDKDVENLMDFDFFPTSVTEESKKRRIMYKADEVRQKAMVSGGDDYEDFLRKANMTLVIDRLNEKNMPRVYELSQRTNQLNYNGYRYSMDELKALESDNSHIAVTLTCKDNFGEYGLIGFVVADKSTGRIEQFFMSCRAQKKRVEHGFYEWLRDKMVVLGHDKLFVSYIKTPKNKASFDMLQELGFKPLEDGSDSSTFVYDKKVPFASSDIVKIIDNTGY